MPEQTISRDAVKTLAIAVGVREAARRCGLSEDRVRQWSCREAWFKALPAPDSVRTQRGEVLHVTTVTKPSDSLASILATDSEHTRIGFSTAARRVAEHVAKQRPSKVLKDSQGIRNIADVASKVHGWHVDQAAQGPTLNMLTIQGDMIVEQR